MKILLTIVFSLFTIGSAFADFSPEIKDVMTQGIAAAEQGFYTQASNFFEEARKIAPDNADVYYNLGLAESNIPGRELRAMAWFGAYMAASPKASNLNAIKELIKTLDTRNQTNLAKLINMFKDSKEKLNQDKELRDQTLWGTADLWVRLGDVERAKAMAGLMSYVSESLVGDIASLLAKKGDFAGAEKMADSITDLYEKHTAQVKIAKTKEAAGDKAGAQKIFDQILASHDANSATIEDLVFYKARKGDIDGAVVIANSLPYPYYSLIMISAGQSLAGDVEGSANTLAMADKQIDRTASPDYSVQGDLDSAIADYKATTPATEDVSVAAWLKLFEAPLSDEQLTLERECYKFIEAYVASLPKTEPSAFQLLINDGKFDGDPAFFLERLRDRTEKMIDMRNLIKGMLKNLIKDPENPWAKFFLSK